MNRLPERPVPLPADHWPLDRPLLQLPPRDALTLRDVLAGGVHIWGATGSGKSSGPMATLGRAMLTQGFGMLVLCAKPSEAEVWTRYAREAHREQHIVRVTPEGPWRFNWLTYELQRPGGGGQTENLVNLLTSVLTDVVEGKQVASSHDPFWERSMKVLLRNAIALLAVAKGAIRLEDLSRLVASAPESREQVNQEPWQQASFCAQVIAEADHTPKTALLAHEVDVAARYFLQELAGMSDRTRSSITATLSASIDTMMHGVLHQLFGTETTFVPEILSDGAIILVDIPLVEYGEVARISGMLLKLMTQRALLRRDVAAQPRPVAIVVDEAQNYVSPFDFEFAAMSRSARATSLYATQGLQNYYARLGVGAEAAVKALLGQFQTQVFCRNNDIPTNQYAADLIARRWHTRMGSSSQNSLTGASHGTSTNQALEYAVQPAEFLYLRNGGPANGYLVDSIMVGRTWSHGDIWLRTSWRQQ